MVHVQAILFASLAASLFSAFLAMLGKQWLNRYESTDMRGSAVERSQNRQRKLDGVVKWYFYSVMESLPLMLQIALLLLGCALSRYLWDIDTTIASVVLFVTSFGVIFYLFIIIAGATTESCPYQTPGSHFLRYLGPKIWNVLVVVAPALANTFKKIIETITFTRSHGTFPTPERRPTWQTAILGLRCISWTLQTSLDKAVHLSALKYIMSLMLEFTEFDSALIVDCFNIFTGCINVSNQRVAITPGLEQLATISAGCFGRAFHRLSIMDPTSSVLADLYQRYNVVFPYPTNFAGLRSHNTVTMAHAVVTGHWDHFNIGWGDDRPSNHEYILIAQVMTEVAQARYRQDRIVPIQILRFAFYSLSQDPLPPASTVADCLEIIAIDLGCDVSDIATLDKRYIRLSFIPIPTLTKT